MLVRWDPFIFFLEREVLSSSIIRRDTRLIHILFDFLHEISDRFRTCVGTSNLIKIVAEFLDDQQPMGHLCAKKKRDVGRGKKRGKENK